MTPLSRDEQVPAGSFLGHLDEIRTRLIKCFVLFLGAALCVYSSFDFIYAWLTAAVGDLVFLSPQDALVARLMVTWSTAVVLISPYVVYHIWHFVQGGLKKNERRAMMCFMPISFCFLAGGACFAYFVMTPILMHFLLSFKTPNMIAMITVSNYLRFLFCLIFSFSIVFQLPLVLLLLTRVGVVTPNQLSQKRRHAFVLMLMLAALLTPPDVVTQLIVVGPLMLLFECGILFSKIVYKENIDG
ncbi:twin-arginine translocase subunit TatC [Candidatus Omnitrophota bacterium]